ncbi:hypothetical protein, partial [Ideonella sp.]|uniref:hypothetical protein n=1 Tax=Ideonella sp. TaxID=1929293 RepID=UPI002B470860
NLRLPLGIYNTSVSRVCNKTESLCQRLDTYFRASTRLEPLEHETTTLNQIIDYVELSVYAAAEHVDDIDSIASGFFVSTSHRDKNASYRKLQKEIKRHKRFISAFANAIKHQQSRIRLFSLEYSHAGNNGCLHGYFIEGVEGGALCPSGVFHKDQQVFSITALVWEILLFLLLCSRELHQFLESIAHQIQGPVNTAFEIFPKAILAASRLPNYTFGEEHPFARSTLYLIQGSESAKPAMYGSMLNGWNRYSDASFGQFASRFEADGSTRSFRFAHPKAVVLQHWD